MTDHLPGFLQGNFAPVRSELDVTGLKVRGQLPRGLNGVLYRNGPNPQFPRADSHWFAGDGMLHAITLEGGGASYCNRWVRTPKWLAEQRAGRALYSGFRGKLPDAPEGTGDDKGVANTNIVRHGGRLLALEEGHLPTEIDPHRLGTRGYCDYGALRAPFTAHPKIDPASGEMLFFGYNAAGPFSPALGFGVVDAAGRLSRYEQFDAPYCSMAHDFAITEHHVVFPVLPLTGSLERATSGRPPYAWEPGKGAFLGLMPRAGSSREMRWFEGEACYAFHVMNAWEERGTIVVEAMVFDEPPLFPHADGSPGDRSRQQARLTRWTLDLNAGTSRFGSSLVDDLAGEFPRIDDRLTGVRHRHGWFIGKRGEGDDETAALVHLDQVSGRRSTWWLPKGDRLSEAVFAPRGAADGEGWMLTVAWRAREAVSELLIFEAADIEHGPLASVEMPQRIPFGFHGNWVASALAS